MNTIRTGAYLSSGAVTFVLIGGGILAYWWSPASPMSRDEPALRLSNGDIEGASQAYLEQARGWGADQEREEALWRAARIEAVELGDPDRAIALLESFQEAWPESIWRAEAYALLAGLQEPHRTEERSLNLHDRVLYDEKLYEAAQTWELAANVNPTHVDAGAWLTRAAGIWMELGEDTRADSTWRRIGQYEDRAVEALMAIAGSRLAESPEEAYRNFRQLLSRDLDLADASLARLGLATALERMERYLEAEEAIDLALSEDLDDPALSQRKSRLETIR